MSRSPWEPTWRRLAATTAVLFAIILAFLAGRVRAGADPGLRSSAAQTQSQSDASPSPDPVSPPQSTSPPGDQATPSQPDFGAPEDSDPPTTHVS